MDLRFLITFQTVVREGSFVAAARALGLAQPTVTLHVQELEAELGLQLFDRGGRKRVLTQAGALLADRVQPLLDAVDALERNMAELRDGKSGMIRIGVIEPAASRRVMPLLGRLCRVRPRLRVHLEAGGTGSVSRGVAEGLLDAGVCSEPPAELGLTFEPLYAEAMALLVPRDHPLARRKPLLAKHLEGHPLLLTDQGCAYRRAIESALRSTGVHPLWSFESGSTASLRAAATQGLGIAFLPLLAAVPAPKGTVVRKLRDLSVALTVGIVTRRDAPVPTTALTALLEAIRAQLGRNARRPLA